MRVLAPTIFSLTSSQVNTLWPRHVGRGDAYTSSLRPHRIGFLAPNAVPPPARLRLPPASEARHLNLPQAVPRGPACVFGCPGSFDGKSRLAWHSPMNLSSVSPSLSRVPILTTTWTSEEAGDRVTASEEAGDRVTAREEAGDRVTARPDKALLAHVHSSRPAILLPLLPDISTRRHSQRGCFQAI